MRNYRLLHAICTNIFRTLKIALALLIRTLVMVRKHRKALVKVSYNLQNLNMYKKLFTAKSLNRLLRVISKSIASSHDLRDNIPNRHNTFSSWSFIRVFNSCNYLILKFELVLQYILIHDYQNFRSILIVTIVLEIIN